MTTDHPTHRLPAEWQPVDAVILSWPHAESDWAYMLESVTECFIRIAKAISKYARLLIVAPDISKVEKDLNNTIDPSRLLLLQMPTNDTWARDFGMLCTTSSSSNSVVANDFKFNGWGLKFAADRDNLITRNIIKSGLANPDLTYANRLNFVLEGGSIDIDEHGTLLTTTECLLSPNRNGESTQEQITEYLKNALGASRVLWLNHGALAGDDTDSHVDTLARFLPGSQIAYSSCDRPSDEHYGELKEMEKELDAFTDMAGHPYKLISLPIPEPIYDEDGLRLPATYANFLIINGAVILPVYGDAHYDEIAVNKIRAALPLYDIVPVPCRELIQQHGSLHCVTMQVPPGILI